MGGQATVYDTTGFADVKVTPMGNEQVLSEIARWIRAQHFDVIFYPEVKEGGQQELQPHNHPSIAVPHTA